MKLTNLLILIFCTFSINVIAAVDKLYFVGGFNNWDIAHPEIAFPDTEGVFEIDIDFSHNREFKLSTVNPEGSWTKFDEGTLYTTGSVKEDEWIQIKEIVKSPNIVAPSEKSYTVRVDMDNMNIMFSSGGSNRRPWSGTLPVMFITTQGKEPITSKETYLQATYYLDPMGVEGIDAVGSEEEQALMQIRGRGNYTWWGFDKKPYRIKLDKKTPLMGMDKSKHFALLAHADDSAAGLRNALGFAASETLAMPWTPSTAPLEVVLNGDYIGLYWLTETVRVDKDRVDVEEQADGATENVDGGWLVEIDNYDSDPHVTVTNSSGGPIWFTYKSPESLSSEQSSYLQSAMQGIQDALASGDEADASQMVDFDILARYFIANQLMLDMESFHGSCYLNKQRGNSEKWKFGPVWDFGNAFSQGRGDNPRFIFDHPEFSQHWIGEFYSMPGFVDTVISVWKSFLNSGPQRLETSISHYADKIAAAAICDGRRWPAYSHADVPTQSARLKAWLKNSIEWLKKQWGSESGVVSMKPESLLIKVSGRELVVDSDRDMLLDIYGIDGIRRIFTIKEGRNTFEMTPGCYFIKGYKIFIRG